MTPEEPFNLGSSLSTRFASEHLQVQKNLQFSETPVLSRPARPTTDATEADASQDAQISGEEFLEALKAAIYWDNIVLSGLLCFFGAVVAVLGDLLIRGKSGIPLVAALAYLLLMDLALNFVRSMLSMHWLEESAWTNSSMVRSVAAFAESTVMRLAALHDAFLSSKDPLITLKVAGILWALVYLAEALSTWRLACCAYFAAFAWGAVQTFCVKELQDVYITTSSQIKEKWAATGLTRRHSGSMLAVCFLLLIFFSSWSTRLLTLFLCLIIVRCSLKPSEVTAIAATANNTCAPYMRSAKKQARRMSLAAADFVRRTSAGTKSHHR